MSWKPGESEERRAEPRTIGLRREETELEERPAQLAKLPRGESTDAASRFPMMTPNPSPGVGAALEEGGKNPVAERSPGGVHSPHSNPR